MLNFKITYKFIKSDLKRFLGSLLIVFLSSFAFYFAYAASNKLEDKLYRVTTALSSHISVEGFFDLSDKEITEFERELKSASLNVEAVAFVSIFMVGTSSRTYIVKSFELNDDYDFYEIKKSFNMKDANFTNPEDLNVLEDGTIPVYFPFVLANMISTGEKMDSPVSANADINEGIGREYNMHLLDDPTVEFKVRFDGKIYSDAPGRRDRLVYMKRENAESLFGLNGYTSVEIMVRNPNRSDRTQSQIHDILEKYLDSYNVVNWQEGSEAISNLIFIEKYRFYLYKY